MALKRLLYCQDCFPAPLLFQIKPAGTLLRVLSDKKISRFCSNEKRLIHGSSAYKVSLIEDGAVANTAANSFSTMTGSALLLPVLFFFLNPQMLFH